MSICDDADVAVDCVVDKFVVLIEDTVKLLALCVEFVISLAELELELE